MAEEMKTRSIRADEETLDKFKALSENFENQGECLSSLIKAYEVNKAKSVLSDVRTNISDYESHINAIQDIFISMLESMQNTDIRVRNEYAVRLDADAKTITDLQNRLTESEAELENAQNLLDINSASLAQLREQNKKADEQINSLQSQIRDKKDIIDSLNIQLSDYLKIKDEYETKNQIIADFKLERAEQTAEIKSLKAEIDKLNTAIETNKKQYELDKQIAVNEIKSKYMDKLENLRTEKDNLISEIAKLKDQIITK